MKKSAIVLMLICLSLVALVPAQFANADTVVNVWVEGENVEIYINGQSLDWIASKISSLKKSISKLKTSIKNINIELNNINIDINFLKSEVSVLTYYLNETMYALNSTIFTVSQHSQAIAYLLENKLQFENYTITELEKLDAKITLYNQDLNALVSEMASDFAELGGIVNELGTFVYDELNQKFATEDVAINVNLDTLWTYFAAVSIVLVATLIGLGTVQYKLRKQMKGLAASNTRS